MEPEIVVSTIVRSHDDPGKVIDSVRSIFPDWSPKNAPEHSDFPIIRDSEEISGKADSLDNLMSILRESRVLDTALDAMAMQADEEGTIFSLSRQSASIGKASFVLEESPLGGTMEISLTGRDIVLWLEQATWHNGRDIVPREVGDDLSMTETGEAAEWFESRRGRRES
ncbi:MAG: RNA-binding domain-containing protein [Candidatus Thalassarchaeaceae archaeon]|nr:RNA-binding domain-containing protein [Candidatus Thalassarchaeaceae archaeon]